jgi:signal transduction histidine kinase
VATVVPASKAIMHRAAHYLLALTAVAMAAGVAALASPWLTPAMSAIFLTPVVIVAVRCGVGPAILAAVAAVLVKAYLFMAPVRSLLIDSLDDAVELAVFALVAGLLGSLSGALRHAERRNVELLASEAAARREAERANRSKDAFLATVSHELRAPLAAVLNGARVLRAGAGDEGRRARAVAAIERAARGQERLVEDLLDLSRAAANQLRLDVLEVDLRAVVADVAATVSVAAGAAGVTVHVEDAAAPVLVLGDAGRLQQVATNLLSNAIRFTPQGGRITVTVERGGGLARLAVRDSGQGIGADLLPYVFEPFRQGDGEQRAGLGLGLAIVKGLVEAHGGAVRAESAGPGQGATFVVELPLLAAARAAAPTTLAG